MSSSRPAVVDTNVVVSGLLSPEGGAPATVLDAMVSGELRFAVSVELLAEYRAVLLRPRIRSRHQLGAPAVDVLLAELARNAVVVDPVRSTLEAPDTGDQFLLDLVATLEGTVLVTGDLALLEAGLPIQAFSPKAFLESARWID